MTELENLLERFRRGGELIAVVTTGVAGAELDFRPEPGKWSIRQIVCHLADTELVLATRCRGILAEHEPQLIRFDQNAWAGNLDYQRRKISHAVESFRRLRAENFDLLKEQPTEAFDRAGIHNEKGRITLLSILSTYAAHVESHARQIQSARQAYKQSKA
ncbi:MAG: DinB family protein [Bryobacterales bacterium]|nr:DinB family protein [Bryobacterales bacterium]